MTKYLIKVKGKHGIVTHKYESSGSNATWLKGMPGKKWHAASRSDESRYGGTTAKVISVKKIKSTAPRKMSYNDKINKAFFG